MAENTQPYVQAARAGESEAWDCLFKRYQLPLYVYVFELVHNEQESLDIVQETFINAARHIDRLRENAKFASWLFGIAHQKCIQHWRKQNRRNHFQEQDSVDVSETEFRSEEKDPGEWLLQKEQEESFFRLLDKLEPPHRSVLLLYFMEEFSLEQISEITGAQIGTVKSRMHYAKRALRKILQENL